MGAAGTIPPTGSVGGNGGGWLEENDGVAGSCNGCHVARCTCGWCLPIDMTCCSELIPRDREDCCVFRGRRVVVIKGNGGDAAPRSAVSPRVSAPGDDPPQRSSSTPKERRYSSSAPRDDLTVTKEQPESRVLLLRYDARRDVVSSSSQLRLARIPPSHGGQGFLLDHACAKAC